MTDSPTSTPPTSEFPTFTIDGQSIPFKPGDSILDAAHRAGCYLPHLCYHPELPPHGSCKLCTVKIDGHFQSACLTPAQPGMKIDNHNDELTDYRRQMIELLFAEGNHFCPSCELAGNCQLQAMAYEFGITHMRFPLMYPHRDKDGTHPTVFLDRDRCIDCALCVRASEDIDHKKVFGLAGRGAGSYLHINSDDGTLGSSTLTSDDLAANICPVGALTLKQHCYSQRPGERLYDIDSISDIGNQRPVYSPSTSTTNGRNDHD